MSGIKFAVSPRHKQIGHAGKVFTWCTRVSCAVVSRNPAGLLQQVQKDIAETDQILRQMELEVKTMPGKKSEIGPKVRGYRTELQQCARGCALRDFMECQCFFVICGLSLVCFRNNFLVHGVLLVTFVRPRGKQRRGTRGPPLSSSGYCKVLK